MKFTFNKKKFKNVLSIFFKIAVFAATIYYIYTKINENKDFNNFFEQFSHLSHFSLFLIIIVFLAMFLNWGLESAKWKILVTKFEKISFFKAFRAVMSGTAFNNWIPNRLGEYFGRILFISFRNRPVAVFAAVLGNVAQWLMTFSFGCAALLVFIYNNNQALFLASLILVIVLISLFFILYFKIGKIHKLKNRFRFTRFLTRYSRVFSWYGQSQLFNILFLSFLRYLTYLLQYYLLLCCFNIEANPMSLLSSVALIFMVQSVLPSFLLTEIGIRGATVLYFAGMFSDNVNGMLAAAYTLWLINLLIPSFLGSLFILVSKNKKPEISS